MGSMAFMKEWAEGKTKDICKVREGLRGLSSKHVALYLLEGAGKGFIICKMLAN